MFDCSCHKPRIKCPDTISLILLCSMRYFSLCSVHFVRPSKNSVRENAYIDMITIKALPGLYYLRSIVKKNLASFNQKIIFQMLKQVIHNCYERHFFIGEMANYNDELPCNFPNDKILKTGIFSWQRCFNWYCIWL